MIEIENGGGATGAKGNGFNKSEMAFLYNAFVKDTIYCPARALDSHFATDPTTLALDEFEHQLKSKMGQAGATESKRN